MIARASTSRTNRIARRDLEQFRQSIESWERHGREASRDGDVELPLDTPRTWPISARSCDSLRSANSTRRPRSLIASTRWSATRVPSASGSQ